MKTCKKIMKTSKNYEDLPLLAPREAGVTTMSIVEDLEHNMQHEQCTSTRSA